MKHLNKFYNYLNESNSLDKEEIEDNLLNLKDIASISNISIEVEQFEGKFRGIIKPTYKVRIEHMNIEKENLYQGTLYVDYAFDQNFWDILDELLTIKRRLGDKYDIGVTINSLIILLCIVEK